MERWFDAAESDREGKGKKLDHEFPIGTCQRITEQKEDVIRGTGEESTENGT
ncbi:MAG: hypothetical protein SynsKO_08110 [Synoicihabitans sp.]